METNLEMTTQDDIEKYLQQSLCFTEDVIEKCKTLGVTRTMLSLSNLDRMTKTISQNNTFKEIPVIDADQLLWLAKYVRYEKKLPPESIDDLMDLRDSWKSPVQQDREAEIEPLREEIKKLKADFQTELESQKKINNELEKEIKEKTKASMIENGIQSGQIFTYQERLKETESNNAALRKKLRHFSKEDPLSKSPLVKLEQKAINNA
jgi:hypothetical protein